MLAALAAQLGQTIVMDSRPGADFAKFLREDRARWGKIIRDAAISLE